MIKSIKSFENPHEFFQQAKPLIESREAEYGLLSGLIQAAQCGQLKSQPTMLECAKDGQTIAVAMIAGLHLIITENGSDFADEIAKYLLKNNIKIPGVIGPSIDSEQFAKRWCELNQCTAKLGMNQRIYELKKVQTPTKITGRARLVTELDVPLLAKWLEGFYLDALPWELPTKEIIIQNASARVPQAMTFFWEDNGCPVSMAALSRPSKRGIAVNGVYTPPEHRQKGYATALVAAVSTEGLNRGKEFCVLYTDLANPTSNSIYQKVGYIPVGDSKNFIFEV
jgi:hypothetical protein